MLDAGVGGLGDVSPEEIPEGVHVLHQRYVPHDWLFRQCSAVVHHGGAGDSASSNSHLICPCSSIVYPGLPTLCSVKPWDLAWNVSKVTSLQFMHFLLSQKV